MTLEEVEAELTKRGLAMTVWITEEWSVWLFCADDPELGIFSGTGDSLADAFARALARWDGKFPEARN